jgi:hypothetical protein
MPSQPTTRGAWVVTTTGLGRGLLTRLRREPWLDPIEYRLDYEPVSVTAGDGRLWVTAKSLRGGHLLRIDPQTGTVDKAIEIDDPQQRSLVGEGAVWTVTKAGAHTLNGDREFTTITRRDPESGRPNGTLDVERSAFIDARPFVNVCGGAVWAHLPESQQRLLILDPHTLRPIGSKPIDFPAVSWAEVACGRDAVWWMANGRVRRLDPRSREVQADIFLADRRSWARPSDLDFAGQGPTAAPTRIETGADGVWVTVSGAAIG